MPSLHKPSDPKKADVFTVIANPVRRQILRSLVGRDLTVTDIAEPFVISRAAISQHLSILLDSGLVTVHKRGREHYYHLHPETFREVYQWIKPFETFWLGRLDALEAYLDEEYPPDEPRSEV